MDDKEYALEMIDGLYEEGDVDLIFFSQIIGIVSYDVNDHPFDKSDKKRMADALLLLRYLISNGDFFAGETVFLPEDKCEYRAYGGTLNDFCESLAMFFEKNGIDDIELKTKFWLRKIKIGKKMGCVPEEIQRLFGTLT
ncbi:hypothetical protein [Herbaspirillum robiniae]|uniref:hypothetical protein n=1 Tax=Herbaspirillum robiniae TaxID=2014887 RepID=UPI000B5431F8|nr:hypothetical protein [Herbaspirillum robiniae]